MTMTPRSWLAMLVVVLLLGCSPKPPVRIGFMGGLADRGSDVGEAGRNGMILAVEQRNKAGGVNGRLIELVVQDDGQNPAGAASAIQALVAARVDAVVGPFISAVATVAVPVANQAGLLLVSPTVTSMDFVGRDDMLIRINRNASDYAREHARALFKNGQRQVAVAYDTGNLSFSASWLKAFREAFSELGGRTVVEVPFASQTDTVFSDVMRHMLGSKPDALLFIANAVDVARLAQQAGKLAPGLPKSASEWASSEALIELGGQAVEGLQILQSYNREDSSARYQQFHKDYVARFGRVPSYSAVNAHDATNVLLQALSRKQPDETAKAAVLKYGPYECLQQTITFDRFGDTPRTAYFNEIREGHFVLVP